MIENNVDTAEEVRFYPSKVLIGGSVFAIIVMGFLLVQVVLRINFSDYSNGTFWFEIAFMFLIVFLLYRTIRPTLPMLSYPLLLKINGDGIFSPSIGDLQWKDIGDISIGDVHAIIRGQPSDLIVSVKLTMIDGKQYQIKTDDISITAEKLLELLTNYRGHLSPA